MVRFGNIKYRLLMDWICSVRKREDLKMILSFLVCLIGKMKLLLTGIRKIIDKVCLEG